MSLGLSPSPNSRGARPIHSQVLSNGGLFKHLKPIPLAVLSSIKTQYRLEPNDYDK